MWKRRTVLPVDDLPVRVVGVLGAERRVSDETLEHDRTTVPKAEVRSAQARRRGQISWTYPSDHQSHSFE